MSVIAAMESLVRDFRAEQVSTGVEVDFLAETPTARELVQVCADLSAPETRERELRAVVEAMEELQATTATLVTLRQEETVELAGRVVRVVPAWRWLLGG